MSSPAAQPPNRLAQETSPYLRQHAHNPVDWMPWGEAAFARARAEDKPIFLSIGYSTCHWCHVMAHESFEDPATAAVMNEHFVNIKVDREERPDVDRVYMTFVQATTGSGGWPLSAWLTPDLTPFYGGTYFPPEDRHGRPGFPSILRALARIWREDRSRALQQGAHAIQMLQQFASRSGAGDATLDARAIEQGLEFFWETFDEQWGGFGDAPKFPRPSVLLFLHRVQAMARERNNAEMADAARQLSETTLRKMIAGGMHDHLGGGFHRYSVDAFWHVPHFEKMLYDQAQLVLALLEAFQISGESVFAEVARTTLGYVRRDLTAPAGGFYSAEDADSLKRVGSDEHAEGAFYVWSADEIRAVLGPEKARRFAAHYGVEEVGNAPAGSDPHGEFSGVNILIERQGPPESPEAARELTASRAALLAEREKRPRPHRDEKIIVAWNGLMISAFARAAQVLDEPMYLEDAARAADFVRRELWDETRGVLRRSFCDGRPGAAGFAEDYACLTQGLLDLYEASFDVQWLRWADEIQSAMDRLFWDETHGGFFSSAAGDASVLVRLKEDHDGAEPAPSSVAGLNLQRLGRMLNDAARTQRAERTLLAFGETWHRSPQALPLMLAGLADALRPPRQVVLAGNPASADFAALAREIRRRYLPGIVVLAADGGAGQAWLAERAAYLRDMRPVEGSAAAYVCENFACQLPVKSAAELGAALERS